MPTQIAATPILKGEDAKSLIDSLQIIPTPKSLYEGERLIDFFRRVERK